MKLKQNSFETLLFQFHCADSLRSFFLIEGSDFQGCRIAVGKKSGTKTTCFPDRACVRTIRTLYVYATSGAGTNLKVRGHRSGAKRRQKFFWGRAPLHFGFKSTISRFWWALSWWSVQFGQFLVCCSSTHGAPRAPFVKVGARAPSDPRSRRHWPRCMRIDRSWQFVSWLLTCSASRLCCLYIVVISSCSIRPLARLKWCYVWENQKIDNKVVYNNCVFLFRCSCGLYMVTPTPKK